MVLLPIEILLRHSVCPALFAAGTTAQTSNKVAAMLNPSDGLSSFAPPLRRARFEARQQLVTIEGFARFGHAR